MFTFHNFNILLCVGSRRRLMFAKATLRKRRLFLSPKKSFNVPLYAEQMVLEFGSSKPNKCRDTYVLNVLEFLDVSTSKGKETSESSTDKDSTTARVDCDLNSQDSHIS